MTGTGIQAGGPGNRTPDHPWLITGATGFLGRQVLERLSTSSDSPPVLALVRNPAEWAGFDWTGPLRRIVLVAGDVTDTGWHASLGHRGLAGVLHLAALVSNRKAEADRVQRVNVTGTLNLVRLAAAEGCRMIFVSTSGTVGCFREPGRQAAEGAPHCEREVRRWPYYRSKVEAERGARELAGVLGVELVIVRPPVLLGPGDHRRRSVDHVNRLLQGRVPFLVRGGMHYADVRDVAGAVVRLMQLSRVRPVYHLPGTQCSIEEFYRTVAELAGVAPPRRVIPYRAAWLAATLSRRLGLRLLPEPALVEMASHWWGLTSEFSETELGYRSRPGRETLRDTIGWLRENPS